MGVKRRGIVTKPRKRPSEQLEGRRLKSGPSVVCYAFMQARGRLMPTGEMIQVR